MNGHLHSPAPKTHIRIGMWVCLYALIACGWIFVTEWILPYLERMLELRPRSLEIFGEVFFVGAIACLLYFLLKRYQQRVEKFVASEEAHLKLCTQFYEMPFVGMAIVSPGNECFLQVNEYLCELLGYSEQEMQQLRWQAIHYSDDISKPAALNAEMLQGDRDSYDLETRYVRKDGQIIFVHAHTKCQRDASGKVGLIFITVENISERVHREQDLQTLNRIHRLVTNISQSIVRDASSAQMLQKACDIAVTDGGFCLAWIGLQQDDGELIPVAWSGEAKGYLESLHAGRHGLDSQGPTGIVMRDGQHVVCNDLNYDPIMAPWREQALALAYQSYACFPLILNGKVRGTFSLYAQQLNYFDGPELQLLDEVANDIAFAIGLFEAERAQKETLISLENSQHQLLLAMDAANLGIWDVNFETRSLTVSDSYYQMLGFDVRSFEPTLDWWEEQMHPDDKVPYQQSLQRQMEEKRERMGVECRCRHADGSWRWLVVTGRVASRDAQGNVVRMVGVNIDITARVELEQQLTRDTERAESLLGLATLQFSLSEAELLQHGLALVQRLTESPIAFMYFVNEEQTESVNTICALADAHHEHAQEEYEQLLHENGILQDCLQQQQSVICNTLSLADDNQPLREDRALLSRLICLPVIEHEHIRIIMGACNRQNNYTQHEIETIQLIANDVWRMVQQRRAEATLVENLKERLALSTQVEDAQQQLLQSEKLAAIGQLAAGVAHELNNPIGFVHSNLGTLDGYVRDLMEITNAWKTLTENTDGSCPQAVQMAELMRAKDYPYICEDLPQLIGESKEGLSRVRQIVQDLKDFSRAGETRWEWANLHNGLDSTLNIAWHELKYKCTVKKEYGELPPVYCLASQLNQVFMNLLVNASHAIEDKGDITISTGMIEDRVWIEIADTGKGIAPEIQLKIFDPFFTTKPMGQGTGLGLSLSYSIIQRHRGSLTVRSQVGCGATFRIEIPIAPPGKTAGTGEGTT